MEDKNIPWITYNAFQELKKMNLSQKKVFEWGSGSSTLYFSDKNCFLTSIEHDQEWFYKTNKILKKLNRKINYYYIPPEQTRDKELHIHSSRVNLKGEKVHFDKYVNHIKNYSNNYFDIIIVDGRCRNDCVKNSIEKLKPGGILILDNSDRTDYNTAKEEIKLWDKRIYKGLSTWDAIPSETTFYNKPNQTIKFN